MNCETVSELLPELLSGSLGREQELELLSHLASCPDCRSELAFWAQVAEAEQDDAEPMPNGLFRGIRDELFGAKATTVLETLRLTGRALGLAGSACRLAFSMAGK